MESVFIDLERFVASHHACGLIVGDAEVSWPDGYRLWLRCSCGVVFERWVTPEAAEYDLLRSRLLTSQN